MAVNVGQRNVPDTPSNNQCYAVDACLDLACHSIKLCKNHNIFTDEYSDIRDKIISIVINIYDSAYTSNKIYPNYDYEKENRLKLQRLAILNCNRLLGIINIAKRLYHLKNGKVEFWVGKILETRNLLQKWHESDSKRYKT